MTTLSDRTTSGYTKNHFSRMLSVDVKSGAGYTLIELIIAIGIFGILTATVFIGFRGTNRIERFRLDADLLASNIRLMQNRALSGIARGGAFPRGGYGIVMYPCSAPPCQYLLFADEDADQRYGIDPVLQTVALSEFTAVDSVEVLDPDGTILGLMDTINISFKPPRPTPFVWWATTSGPLPMVADHGEEGKRVRITLSYVLNPSVTRIIEVKGISGQISEYTN